MSPWDFSNFRVKFTRWWLDFTLFRGSTKSLKIWAELLRGFREIFLGMPWGVGHLTRKFPSAQNHLLCSRRRRRWGCRCWSRPQTASWPRWAGDPARRWPPGGDSTGVTTHTQINITVNSWALTLKEVIPLTKAVQSASAAAGGRGKESVWCLTDRRGAETVARWDTVTAGTGSIRRSIHIINKYFIFNLAQSKVELWTNILHTIRKAFCSLQDTDKIALGQMTRAELANKKFELSCSMPC